MGNGSSVTQVNTTVDTGSLLLRSGGDTTLAGAQVRADEINALIDGNLNIISRQDTQDQKSKQSSGGFGASICVPPFCYGTTVAASANLAAGKMNSEYKGVTEQTGLFAGTGGYTVDVGKTTTLEGGVIASDASADKNTLITDRLIARDIKNVSEIKAQSAGISISGSYGGAGASASVGGLYGIALSESDKSHTRSAVSEGTIIVRNPEGAKDVVALNRDTANANEKLDKPDEKAMNDRIELVKSSVELVKGVGDAISAARINEAKDRDSEASKVAIQKLRDQGIVNPTDEQINQQVQRDYGMGSSFQKASQAIASIVQGVLGGNVVGALSGAAAPYIAQEIRDATVDDPTANLMAHAVLGALVAKANGNSALAGAVGAVAAEETARIIKEQLYGGVSNEQLTPEQKQTISSLATLVAGISGASVGTGLLDAVAAASGGKNAVENNYLSLQEAARKTVLERKERTGTLSDEEKVELSFIKQIDKDRDGAIASVCTAGNKSGGACSILAADAKAVLAQYGESVSYNLLYKDLYPADAKNVEAILQGLGPEDVTKDVVINALAEGSGLSREEVERRYDTVMTLQTMVATLAGFSGLRGLGTKTTDGAGDSFAAPTISYKPNGSVVLQGKEPVCGPACAAMTITDATGTTVSLDEAIGRFANGIRPSGVNTLELSKVITDSGVKNTVETTMFPEMLNKALENGNPVIVQVRAGTGYHFMIVDSVKVEAGASYYMTRDPFTGPRGVLVKILDGAMSTGANAIVIGK
jgi:filamentous hemagglutinin